MDTLYISTKTTETVRVAIHSDRSPTWKTLATTATYSATCRLVTLTVLSHVKVTMKQDKHMLTTTTSLAAMILTECKLNMY